MKIAIIPSILLWCCFALAANLSAADETGATDSAKSNFEFSGSATLVNDYIWRGQSQTWGNPALQLGLEVSHSTGLYAGAWASNVSNQWVPGGHVETDFYAGLRDKFAGPWSALGYDLNVLCAYYPGGNFDKTGFTPRLQSTRPTGVEASVALNYQSISLKTGRMLTSFYGWNTNNSPTGAFAGDASAGITGNTRGSWFFEANANHELAPGWSINGQLGRETISHARHLDWNYYKAGVTRTLGAWAASLAYSASSEPAAFKGFVGLTNNGETYDAMRPRLLFSLSRSF